MEKSMNLTSTGVSAWAPAGMCIAPNAQHQGTAVPMGQLADVPFAGYASVAPTALRTADVKVPDPRGRKR